MRKTTCLRARSGVVMKNRSVRVALGAAALLGFSTAGAASAGAASAHKSTRTVVLRFWNAYNDVTETPVMNKARSASS